MTRIYYSDSKRKKLTQEALLELRRTRRLIDPELLEQALQVIASRSNTEKTDKIQQDNRQDTEGFVVDKRKNLTTIMKFIQLKSPSEGFQKQIQALFTDDTQH